MGEKSKKILDFSAKGHIPIPKGEGGGGLFPIPKKLLQIFAIIKGSSVMNFGKNPQHDFPKMRGGGQRPFGTFPKIHPFWRGDASLRQGWQRKEKKREKKLSNCLAGLAICPHKKLGNNSPRKK